MNTIARLTGFRFFERTKRNFELRFSWAEITGNIGFGLALINWSEDRDWSLHVHLGWPNIYLKLPFLPRRDPRDQMMDQWGFSFFERDVHLHWGHRTKIMYLPWHAEWVRTSIMQADGTWAHETKGSRKIALGNISAGEWRAERDRAEASRWKETHPYTYVLQSGEVQQRMATIGVEEREWRWRWLTWQPWFTNVRRTINVQFDGEVGERTGSWKGGVLGCGYELCAGETPLACLRRMEAERKF